MPEAAFGVTYDGPALTDGRMAVRDLAPALLALGDLFADASTLLYPDQEPISLNIEATQEGSFVVDLVLHAAGDGWKQVIHLFGSDEAQALANVKELVIGGGVGLFAFIKWVGKRRIKKREKALKPGYIKLTLEDGASMEIPGGVYSLYERLTVRRKIKEVVAPLSKEGIERITFSEESRTELLTISKAELPIYDDLPEVKESPLLERETEMVLSIASVAFVEGNKWKLSDGEHTFFAALEDEDFIRRVENGLEAFRKGDMLQCKIRITQSQKDGKLNSEYVVLEVVKHIRRDIQLTLED